MERCEGKNTAKDRNLAPETEASLFGGSLVARFLPENEKLSKKANHVTLNLGRISLQ